MSFFARMLNAYAAAGCLVGAASDIHAARATNADHATLLWFFAVPLILMSVGTVRAAVKRATPKS